MKSTLVTGSSGFLASHLIDLLLKQGWNIRAAVRTASKGFTYYPISFVIGNIDGNTNWQKVLQNIDTVIHLAARAHILNDNTPNPEAEFYKVNTQGTANLVKQSIQAGVKHFIFISSIGAMATLSNQPLTETSPCQPDTSYGRSKLQAEQALISLASKSNMTWTIIRPTLVYGPGNPGNMARLIKLINRGLPLPFDLINNRRSFLYVGNLANAIATCLTHPNAKNQTFLISDGEDISTVELVRKIAYYLDSHCPIVPVPLSLLKIAANLGDNLEQMLKRSLPLNTPTLERLLGSLVVDSSYIRTTLNWQPPYTLDQGLSQTLCSSE